MIRKITPNIFQVGDVIEYDNSRSNDGFKLVLKVTQINERSRVTGEKLVDGLVLETSRGSCWHVGRMCCGTGQRYYKLVTKASS